MNPNKACDVNRVTEKLPDDWSPDSKRVLDLKELNKAMDILGKNGWEIYQVERYEENQSNPNKITFTLFVKRPK